MTAAVAAKTKSQKAPRRTQVSDDGLGLFDLQQMPMTVTNVDRS